MGNEIDFSIWPTGTGGKTGHGTPSVSDLVLIAIRVLPERAGGDLVLS